MSSSLVATQAMSMSYPQPTIVSFTPSVGTAGTIVTVTGAGFTGLTSAWIGNAHDAKVDVLSDSKVRITVPKNATTSHPGLLNPQHAAFADSAFTVAHGSTSTVSGTITRTGSPTEYSQPMIYGFSPSSGPVGTVITMIGKGFTGLASAWIGNGHDAPVSVMSDTVVKVTVPKDATSAAPGLLNLKHAAFSPNRFTVTAGMVSSAGGGSGSGAPPAGPPRGGTPPVTSPPVVSGVLKVSVSGDHFIDGSGRTIQLRGVNVSGLEGVAVIGWDPANPWGGQTGDATPNWSTIQTWKSNTVRLPLNEASWLGYHCVDATGAMRDPDPGHNYQATLKKSVADASAAGLYVILDLHWTAPKNVCPLAQNPMADADHSIDFWSSIAATFKGYPNVLFELFNEPYTYWIQTPGTDWQVVMQGGTMTQYVTGGAPYQVAYNWQVAGMQQMLNAVRATGASNVVLSSGVNWAGDLSEWLANMPKDPLKQLAAVWHAYPGFGATWGTAAYAVPNGGAAQYDYAQSIISAGVPVIITETGDHNAPGTVGAPFVSKLLPWADKAGVSYLGWTWDVWGETDNVLIKDAAGTPSDGYGVYFKQHLLCVASSVNCP